ncbi:MAG: branched-chain amino acid ABC transporter permease [Actinomycetia bacterium]|nr:branched-chain amino acid ABC transporter permease [Actinomycetes bacterium]
MKSAVPSGGAHAKPTKRMRVRPAQTEGGAEPGAGRPLPKWMYWMTLRSWITAVVAVGFIIWTYTAANDVITYYVDMSLLAAMSAMALNFLNGNAGLVSMGTATFQGCGAYLVVITGKWFTGSWNWPLALLLGTLAAGLVGFLIGIPSLRLHGLYLLFATLGLIEIGLYAFNWYDTKSGALSGTFVKRPRVGGFVLQSEKTWLLVLCVLLAIATWLIYNMVSGDPGRILAAVKSNENAASAMGIGVVSAKLRTFVTMAMLSGFGGAVAAYFLQSVGSDYYSFLLSVTFIAMVLVGGLSSVRGSIIGAFAITFLPLAVSTWLDTSILGPFQGYFHRHLGELQTVFYGALIVIFIFFFPGGFESLINLGKGRKRRRELEKLAEAADGASDAPASLAGPAPAVNASLAGAE